MPSPPKVVPVDATVARLTWSPVALGDDDGPVTQYYVHAKTTTRAGVLMMTRYDVRKGALSYEVRDLAPSLAYEFAVQARNAVGSGPLGAYSAPVELSVREPWHSVVVILSLSTSVCKCGRGVGSARMRLCEWCRYV